MSYDRLRALRAIERAIEHFGTVSAFAARLGLARTYVHRVIAWLKKSDRRRVSPELAIRIERLTKGLIRREDLRSDLFELARRRKP